MSVLGPVAIRILLARGDIVCDPAPARIETHIDVTLGPWFWWPRDQPDWGPTAIAAFRRGMLHLDEVEPVDLYELHHADEFDGQVVFAPRGTTLVHTREQIGTTVADLLPIMHTRSTVARWGCSSHRTAGLGDCGFRWHWTGEVDHTWPVPVAMPVGARIGSITFLEVSGAGADLYEGRYNQFQRVWTPQDMLPRANNLR
jgi:deoxycytidine triphosphate deaminase